MTVAKEEIFGPVLCVIAYEVGEDEIRIANDSLYGFSGYRASRSLWSALPSRCAASGRDHAKNKPEEIGRSGFQRCISG
jgi:aldehyde dehydrogenase (NAD+)